jgi:hypothetical protein
MLQKKFSFPITTLAGTSLRNFRAICRGHKIGRKYLGKMALTVLVSGIFEIFNACERLIWTKRIRKFNSAEPPLFVIGYWRSGTTFLHTLLCQDPRAAYTTTFQTVFPNIFLSQSWWLKPLARLIVPSRRPFDNVKLDMDFPQEEEFGLMNLQPYSIYKFFIFPADFDQIIGDELFTAELPEKSKATWRKHYREMVAKASFNTGGSRFISKNPCNLTRLGFITELYPEAKFVFIHRNPYQAVESLYRFIIEIFPGVQLQDTPADFNREKVALLYEKIIRSYLKDRHMISPQNLVELRMEDLVEDPVKNVRMIYDKFRMEGCDEAISRMQTYIADSNYSRNGSYRLEPESIRLVNKYLSDIPGILGYERIEEI